MASMLQRKMKLEFLQSGVHPGGGKGGEAPPPPKKEGRRERVWGGGGGGGRGGTDVEPEGSNIIRWGC